MDAVLNTDFMSEKNVDALNKMLEKESTKHKNAKPEKMRQVLYVYYLMKHLVGSRNGARVSYEMCAPYPSMASVSVTGKKILFNKNELFMRAIELSDNFDVYPKTNGTVQIDFTFHKLTKEM